MDVRVNGDWISWFDTVKERLMRGEILENTPERFSFKRTEGDSNQTYSFVPMTLDIYHSAVKSRLSSGQDFSDDQSMIDAFLAIAVMLGRKPASWSKSDITSPVKSDSHPDSSSCYPA